MENTESKIIENNLLSEINNKFETLKNKFKIEPKNMNIDDLINLSKGLTKFFQDIINDNILENISKLKNAQLQCLVKTSQMIKNSKCPEKRTKYNTVKFYCDLFYNITSTISSSNFENESNISNYFKYLQKTLSGLQDKEDKLKNIDEFKNNESHINNELIQNVAEKLYISCKNKLNSLYNRNIFGKDKVDKFFNKCFSEHGKNFSKKYIEKYKLDSLKKLNKKDTIKHLENLKEDIKSQCLKLMGIEKARVELRRKWEKIITSAPFEINNLAFNEGINIFVNSSPLEDVRKLYVFFKKNFTSVKKKSQNKKLIDFVIEFLQDNKNFRKGKNFFSYDVILNKLITSMKDYDK